MYVWLLQKVFLFSSKLARRWEQLSWLVKKEHLFPKIIFSKGFNSWNSTLCKPLPIQISTFFQKYVVRGSSMLGQSKFNIIELNQYCYRWLKRKHDELCYICVDWFVLIWYTHVHCIKKFDWLQKSYWE